MTENVPTYTSTKRTAPTASQAPQTGGGSGKPRWTVMIFMGAGHIDGVTAPLDQYARQDIEEIHKALAGGTDPSVNVFVELHTDEAVERQWIGHKGVDAPAMSPGLSDGKALTSFVDWCLRASGHQDGDYSMLVMWGHAYQFAIGARRTPIGIDALDYAELSQVLKASQANWKATLKTDFDPRLDVIAFDACDVSTIEVANLLHPFANYLIASEIGVPLPGWPYHTILNQLLKSRTSSAPMGPAALGSYIVRRFCEEYRRAETDTTRFAVSLTMLDLHRASDVYRAAEHLAGIIALAGGQDESELQRIATQFARAQTIAGHPFVDVADFCLNVVRSCTNDELRMAAAALGDMLIRPRPLDSATSGPFILEHARNSHLTAKLQGVSLYAPQIANGQDWRATRFWYDKLGSADGASVWSQVIHVLAEES
jgi:hypothetical protein